ncbi:MAG: methionyl-tRNA formyltransferase [bacterium]|nr:methionyl-tRNA formyltransferase [bacterium]
MRILFMGTPELAIPSLEAARDVGRVVGVVSQPPKGGGRGRKVTPSPVAEKALEWGIDPLVPESVRADEFIMTAASLEPDVALVVAYGKILPPGLLAVPRLGCVNIHASLLPGLRGAAPIQWAVARGFTETGVTLMQMDEGMDTGPILLQKSTPIGMEETAGELARRLAVLGAGLVREGLPALHRGELVPREQDGSSATYAPLLSKEDGRIDWNGDAVEISNRVRGFSPWPGTFTTCNGARMIITRGRTVQSMSGNLPGTVLAAGSEGIAVACGKGALLITSVKPEGKREMTAAQYVSGYPLETGDVLGE